VYVLLGGRASWTVLGLPTEGSTGDRDRVAGRAQDVATVPATATIGDVTAIADPEPMVAVIDCDGVLVGALRPAAGGLRPDTPVRDVMLPAPTTIRPDVRIAEAAQRLADDGLDHVFVTTAYGVLVGLVTADDLRS
jgi:CBS domain-containing protein